MTLEQTCGQLSAASPDLETYIN